VKLFLREKEGVSLTEEGKILFKYTEKILELYEKATKEIDHFRHASLNRIIMGASTTLGEYVLPQLISLFKKNRPEAEIYLKVANTEEIIKLLSSHAFNLALFEGRFDNNSFVAEKIFQDELVLIVSAQHKWAEIGQINFSELRTEPLIIREQGSGTRKVLEEELAKLGVTLSDLNIKMELDSTEAVKNAVSENLGVSFVSRSTLLRMPDSIKVVSISNTRLLFDFNLVYSREKGLTSLTLEFIECLKERFSNKFGIDIFSSCV
jgi:DNA-binding transcriptional LysR family regulator